MEMDRILYVLIYAFCILILLSLSNFVRKADQSTEKLYLYNCILVECLFFFSSVIWGIVDGNSMISVSINYLINLVFFTSTILASYYWFNFVHHSLTGTDFTKLQKALFLLPVLATFVMCSITFSTGWFYYIDDAHCYHRGDYYSILVAIDYVYIAAIGVYSLYVALTATVHAMKVRAFVFTAYIVIPAIAALLEIYFPNLGLVGMAVTFSLVINIFSLQNQMITIDALTKLNNRYRLIDFLEHRLVSFYSDVNVYMLYVDVNDFKYINDHFGHLEGDSALCIVADAMRNICRHSPAFAARIGGDEFVIVFDAKTDAIAEAFLANLKDSVSVCSKGLPYSLTISAGLARYEIGESLTQFMDRADKALYVDKANKPSIK